MQLEGKRIVVTGGAGFLGRCVVDVLRRNGGNVFVVRSKEFDLRDLADVRRMYAVARPEIIVHLAAVVGGIGANRANPGRYFYENAIMGIQLIEEARRYGVEKFVATGTICSYPKFSQVPFQEDAIWDGYPEETNAPYGLAKKMMLVQLQAYRQQYGFNGIFLLPVNLYGPYDNFDLETSHVIPAMIRKFDDAVRLGHEEVVLWGTGSPSREFLYVEDCANAIVMATQHYDGEQAVNIGTGEEIRIRALAEKIAIGIGFKGRIVWDAGRPDGQPRRCLDISRAEQEFGFRANISFDEGLRRTIEWWQSHGNAPVQ